MKAYKYIFLILVLALLHGCAMFQASSMPKMSEAKTPAERVMVAYGELQVVSNTVNNLKASGVVFSEADLNEIADTIDKLRMVVDLYTLSQIPDITPSYRLKLKSQFDKNARIYAMALEIYNGYENTADGQLRALMMINTLAIELIQQLEEKDNDPG